MRMHLNAQNQTQKLMPPSDFMSVKRLLRLVMVTRIKST